MAGSSSATDQPSNPDLPTMWSSLRLQLDAHRPTVSRPRANLPEDHQSDSTVAPRPGRSITPVPVAILTGFLGAGKSTLLVRLLTQPPDGLVVRAVVNDVGSLPFDPTMIASASRVEVELSNGCGCCERAADLAETLREIASPTSDPEGRPGLVVLEAAGAADPLALAQIVEVDSTLSLDRIVTVVDVSAMRAQLADASIGHVLRRQLDAAHCVVASHIDALSGYERAAVIGELAELAPGRVITTSSLEEPAAEILTPQGIRGARLLPSLDGPSPDGLELVTLTLGQGRSPINRSDFEQALGERASLIVRAKGRLELDDGYVFVQVTSSNRSIESTERGPCGLTIVTRSRADLIDVIEALGLNPGTV